MATKYEPSNDSQAAIAAILGSAASAKRVEALEDLFSEWLSEADRSGELVEAVGVKGSRVPIEHIEAYGLTIGVDANGYAATVSSVHGLEIA